MKYTERIGIKINSLRVAVANRRHFYNLSRHLKKLNFFLNLNNVTDTFASRKYVHKQKIHVSEEQLANNVY